MMHPLFRYRTIGFSFFIEYDLGINFSQSVQKECLSLTPLNCARKFFILALKDSDAAFVERFSKKFNTFDDVTLHISISSTFS